jgi:hypothetical protein
LLGWIKLSSLLRRFYDSPAGSASAALTVFNFRASATFSVNLNRSISGVISQLHQPPLELGFGEPPAVNHHSDSLGYVSDVLEWI